jgi:NAD-dependent dihydropyrimidine dehydrogenase PreA subunit
MTHKIYKKLARHLDNLPGGFPSTESGVELRILEKLFSPEEAQFALYLSLIPEEAHVIARRAGVAVEDAARRLSSMALKGLINRMDAEGKPPLYLAAQYAIGIWEAQVNTLDEDLARMMEEYGPTLIREAWKKPQLRTIPVNRSLAGELKVMTYENAEELLRDVKKCVVAPCICRKERKLLGQGCDKPMETCLVFNSAATYYLRNGLGREISRAEALDVLKQADEAGLVLQPTNAKKVVNICCCCGDCCGVLRVLKTFPKPADMVSSAFSAVTDPEKCTGCGICEERCQMDAVRLIDGTASVDADRCIGCGLCVSTCPTQAVTLIRKAEADQSEIPRNVVASWMELGRSRGKLKPSRLAIMQVKSKVDRLLATK